LKHELEAYLAETRGVETLRKPSTGLKPIHGRAGPIAGLGRDTQKTQHGIETVQAS